MPDNQPEPLRRTPSLRLFGRWPVYVPAVAIAILAVAGVTSWMMNPDRYSSRCQATRFRFESVALSLMNYSEFRGHLPYPVVRRGSVELPTGDRLTGQADQPLYSWRVEIIPYLEAWHGPWHPSQPWDHPTNKPLDQLSLYFSYEKSEPAGGAGLFPEANVLAITGPGTAFGDGTEPPMALKDVPPDAILAVETRASAIPWPAPGDFDVLTMPRTINAPDGRGISSRCVAGFHVIFADGQMWLISNKVPFETLRRFFTTSGAAKYDREASLGPFFLQGR